MRVTRYLMLPVTILLMLPMLLKAQTQGQGQAQELTETQSSQQSSTPDPPQAQTETLLPFGPFQVQGSATMGYRFTNVYGFKPMYQTLFDLNSGPRLLDFNLFGEAQKPNPFADDFSLTMSGLGGDPFPTAQLTVSKHKLYDLRATWQQAYFYEAGNNSIALPTLGIAGLTDNLDYATVRKIGTVDFTIHATNNLRFHFQYYRTTYDGTTFTTFSPDFLDSPGSWGTYARGTPYPLYSPIYNTANRFTGGLDYTFHSWTFHYDVGYQTYNETMNFSNTASPELSIDTSVATNPFTTLTHLAQTDFRQLTTPVSEFSYTGRPASSVELRGDYIYYRYSGPATLDQSFSGIAPTTSTATPYAPYGVVQSGRDQVSEPDNIIDQGVTFTIKPWWDLDIDERYSRFTTDDSGILYSLFTGGIPASTTAPSTLPVSSMWRDGENQLDLNLVFTPTSNLLIRPGISWINSNVESLQDGVVDPSQTLRWNTVEPAFSAFYRPSKWFNVRGDLHSFTNSASYTAITPHTDLDGRVVLSFHPTPSLSVDDEVNLLSQRLLDTNFHNKVYSNSTVLTWAPRERFSFFGGFTYDNEIAQGDIVYVRGTPPLSDFLRDQDLNHVWEGGIEAKPLRYVGFRFSGNYDRTTGLGQITGESPVYGPETFPYATGTVYFDLPRFGRLAVDLQRTYYIQQIVTGNNFSANLLTISWTHAF
jgi:hypothetical protein